MNYSRTFESLALEVRDFLKENGAVRDGEAVGAYYTVREIADEVGFSVVDWLFIKEKMILQDIDICYLPGKGHYLGGEGEAAMNAFYATRMADGWSRRAGIYLNCLKRNSRKKTKKNYRSWFEKKEMDYQAAIDRYASGD